MRVIAVLCAPAPAPVHASGGKHIHSRGKATPEGEVGTKHILLWHGANNLGALVALRHVFVLPVSRPKLHRATAMIDSIRWLWPYHKHGISLIQLKRVVSAEAGAWRELCNSSQNRVNRLVVVISALPPDWRASSAQCRIASRQSFTDPGDPSRGAAALQHPERFVRRPSPFQAHAPALEIYVPCQAILLSQRFSNRSSRQEAELKLSTGCGRMP